MIYQFSVILNLTDDVLEYLRSDEFYLPIRFVVLFLLLFFNWNIFSANEAMDSMRHINAESSDDEDPVRILFV